MTALGALGRRKMVSLPPSRTAHADAKRAFDAMMEMKKIDIAAIEAARRG